MLVVLTDLPIQIHIHKMLIFFMLYFDLFSPPYWYYLNIESCTFLIIWASIVTSFEENKVFKIWLSAYAVLCICYKPSGSETSLMPKRLFGTCRAGVAPIDMVGRGWTVSPCNNPALTATARSLQVSKQHCGFYFF